MSEKERNQENKKSSLTEAELKYYNFCSEISQHLVDRCPQAPNIPVVYIGSGGDAITAILSTGSDHVVMVDPHHFLSKALPNSPTDNYRDISETLEEAINNDQFNTGQSVYWDIVRPAVQILSELNRFGIDRENISIIPDKSGNAQISVDLPTGRKIKIDYLSTKITNQAELTTILNKLSINTYGLMAKGGGGEDLMELVKPPKRVGFFKKRNPVKYFITDDPRSYLFRPLTTEVEATLYPDYQLSELQSQETSWGYDWGENPGDVLQSDERSYTARVVVGVPK